MRKFKNRRGMTLAADVSGDAGAPGVVLLHGGGQTRHSWGAALAALGAAGYYALSLDLRGHGESDWAPDGAYDLQSLREDLLDVLAALPPRPALVGASLGGLTALLAEGAASEPVSRVLVLVDVVPKVEPEGAAEIFRFMSANPSGFATVDDAANAVAAYLPHRTRPPSHRGLMKNLRLREDGRYYWHWDPKMLDPSRRDAHQSRQALLEDAARLVTVPTLLIRGGRSRVVSPEGVAAFLDLMPHATFVNIETADHMVAGDANDAFNGPLLAFLDQHRDS